MDIMESYLSNLLGWVFSYVGTSIDYISSLYFTRVDKLYQLQIKVEASILFS